MEHVLQEQKQTRRQESNLTGIPVQQEMPSVSAAAIQLKYKPKALVDSRLETVFLHRNSAQPALYGANAMIQGRHIFIAPGQSGALRHELAHLKLGHPWNAVPERTENGVGICGRPDWEAQADRLAGTLEPSSFSLVETSGGAPSASGEPLLLQQTAHEQMLERYRNKKEGKPAKTLWRQNFTDYQRMLYWMDYSIALSKKELEQSTGTQALAIETDLSTLTIDTLRELFKSDVPMFISTVQKALKTCDWSKEDVLMIVHLILSEPYYQITDSITQLVLDQDEDDPLLQGFAEALIGLLEEQTTQQGAPGQENGGAKEKQQSYQTAFVSAFLTKELLQKANGIVPLFQNMLNYDKLFQAIQENDSEGTLQKMICDFTTIFAALFPQKALFRQMNPFQSSVLVCIQEFQQFFQTAKLQAELEKLVFKQIKTRAAYAIELLSRLPVICQNIFPAFYPEFKEVVDKQDGGGLATKEKTLKNLWENRPGILEDCLDANERWPEITRDYFYLILSEEDVGYVKRALTELLDYLAGQIPPKADVRVENNKKTLIHMSHHPEELPAIGVFLQELFSQQGEAEDESRAQIKTSVTKQLASVNPDLCNIALNLYQEMDYDAFQKDLITQYLIFEWNEKNTVPGLLSLFFTGTLLSLFLNSGCEFIKMTLSSEIWNLFRSYIPIQIETYRCRLENLAQALAKQYGSSPDTGKEDAPFAPKEEAAIFQSLRILIFNAIAKISKQRIAYLKEETCGKLISDFKMEENPDCIRAVAQLFPATEERADLFFQQALSSAGRNQNTFWQGTLQVCIADLIGPLSRNKMFTQYMAQHNLALNQGEEQESSRIYLNRLMELRRQMISWPEKKNMPLTVQKVMDALQNYAEGRKDTEGGENAEGRTIPERAVYKAILDNYREFAARSNEKYRMSLASIHPRHIIPYSDIKGVISVLFSNNPFQPGTQEQGTYNAYQDAAFHAIEDLIHKFSEKNKELNDVTSSSGERTETGYDGRIAALWNQLSGQAYHGLQSPSVRKMVKELIPLLANHPCNIFMGDAPQNVLLGNRFDAGEEGIAMYHKEYITQLLTWWHGILGKLELNPRWNSEDEVYESDVSHRMEGNIKTLDQVQLLDFSSDT